MEEAAYFFFDVFVKLILKNKKSTKMIKQKFFPSENDVPISRRSCIAAI